MRELARAHQSNRDLKTLASFLPDPPAIDAYLRRYWRIVPDPIEYEFVQSPTQQIELAKQSGEFVGDCDDAATLAAALAVAIRWPAALLAIRELATDIEFSHVWLRCPMPDGGVFDVDPIVPAARLPLTHYAELLEIPL